jgi:hypothetical protein
MAAMILRHRWVGSEAFRRHYTVSISTPSTDIPADGSEPEWKPEWRHRPYLVRFLAKNSGLRYRAIVSDSELPRGHPDPGLVYQEILLDWAVRDIGMDGPLLGESSRFDGLQGHDLARDDSKFMKSAASGEASALAAGDPTGLAPAAYVLAFDTARRSGCENFGRFLHCEA